MMTSLNCKREREIEITGIWEKNHIKKLIMHKEENPLENFHFSLSRELDEWMKMDGVKLEVQFLFPTTSEKCMNIFTLKYLRRCVHEMQMSRVETSPLALSFLPK